MDRDDIIRMAQECQLIGRRPYLDGIYQESLERFHQLAVAAEREKVAAWMIQRSYATGHGDTIEDLLKELEWQVAERERERIIAANAPEIERINKHIKTLENAVTDEREACAELVWPIQQIPTWSEEELTAMTGAFNRAQEKHGWYETIMAVGAAALKGRAAAIRARGQE